MEARKRTEESEDNPANEISWMIRETSIFTHLFNTMGLAIAIPLLSGYPVRTPYLCIRGLPETAHIC